MRSAEDRADRPVSSSLTSESRSRIDSEEGVWSAPHLWAPPDVRIGRVGSGQAGRSSGMS